MFQVTKSYLHHEMDRGAKAANVKRIRIHDLRHSHISLLIEMGFSALAIADRVGHESIDITYRYAHLFPNKQTEMADKLDMERMESLAQTDNCTVIQFHMDKAFEPERRKGI
jgi:integrase